MKRILSVTLIVAMLVCVFSACGKGEEKKGGGSVVISEEKNVENTVKECVEALFKGDENALKHIDKDGEAYPEMEEVLNVFKENNKMFSELGQQMGIGENYYDDVEMIANKAVEDIFSKASITVDSVKIEGENAEAAYTMGMPDIAAVSDVITEDFMEKILSETYTEDELVEMQNTVKDMDDDEARDYMSEFMIKVFEKILDAMVDVSTADIVEKTGTMELVKKNDKWIIVSDK